METYLKLKEFSALHGNRFGPTKPVECIGQVREHFLLLKLEIGDQEG